MARLMSEIETKTQGSNTASAATETTITMTSLGAKFMFGIPANTVHEWAQVILAVGAVLAVLGTVLTTMSGKILARESNEQIAQANRQAAIAGDSAARANESAALASGAAAAATSDAAKADLRAAQANEEAAKAIAKAAIADENAARANASAERLRAQNLELEKAVSPRFFEQYAPTEALKSFQGISVFVTSAPDFESRRMAGQLRWVVTNAGWKRFSGPANTQFHYFDGVNVFPAQNELAREAATALVKELQKQDMHAAFGPFPRITSDRPEITIVVGPKPLPESLMVTPKGFVETKEGTKIRMYGNTTD
jgi:hypothetical protein